MSIQPNGDSSDQRSGQGREWHGTHHSWSYRPHAFRWVGEQIAGINIVPIATAIRAWMMQRGKLSIISPAECYPNGGYTNPYTISGNTLSFLMSSVINASHRYATTQTPGEGEVDAEVERIRLFNEVLLYSARLCEVAIKQLLYCTQIPESRYRRMPLGALLEAPCPSCRKENGKQPHLVSLVGTLAHPFHLCLEFEHCAMDHMDLVNRLRNSQAAHAGSQVLNIRSAQDSKAQLLRDSTETLTGCLHMMSHLEQLEQRMLDDLADKAEAIFVLKKNGLRVEDCNFNFVPGEQFKFVSSPSAQ